MNIEGLRQKLLGIARAEKPDDRVPYAFEKRIMALIAGRPVADHWAVWVAPLWRAAVSCVAIMVLFSTLAIVTEDRSGGVTTVGSTELAQDFDQTLYAAVDQSTEE